MLGSARNYAGGAWRSCIAKWSARLACPISQDVALQHVSAFDFSTTIDHHYQRKKYKCFVYIE